MESQSSAFAWKYFSDAEIAVIRASIKRTRRQAEKELEACHDKEGAEKYYLERVETILKKMRDW